MHAQSRTIFAQGGAADAVFYIQEGKVRSETDDMIRSAQYF
jgi:hypothetical protein